MQRDFLDGYDPPTNHVGFTGSREGLTRAQDVALRQWLAENGTPTGFHHGDCVGADAAFDKAVRDTFLTPAIETHPGTYESLRAHCEARGPTVVHEPRRFDRRNLEIVRRSQTVLVGPKYHSEQQRGGTWQTYRLARREGCQVLVIWPDGRIEDRSSGSPKRPIPDVSDVL